MAWKSEARSLALTGYGSSQSGGQEEGREDVTFRFFLDLLPRLSPLISSLFFYEATFDLGEEERNVFFQRRDANRVVVYEDVTVEKGRIYVEGRIEAEYVGMESLPLEGLEGEVVYMDIEASGGAKFRGGDFDVVQLFLPSSRKVFLCRYTGREEEKEVLKTLLTTPSGIVVWDVCNDFRAIRTQLGLWFDERREEVVGRLMDLQEVGEKEGNLKLDRMLGSAFRLSKPDLSTYSVFGREPSSLTQKEWEEYWSYGVIDVYAMHLLLSWAVKRGKVDSSSMNQRARRRLGDMASGCSVRRGDDTTRIEGRGAETFQKMMRRVSMRERVGGGRIFLKWLEEKYGVPVHWDSPSSPGSFEVRINSYKGNEAKHREIANHILSMCSNCRVSYPA